MELNSFLNIKDTLQKDLKKAKYSKKTIKNKIFCFKSDAITIIFFYNEKYKFMKVYYLDSLTLWKYKVKVYYSDSEKNVTIKIKNHLKEIENKKYGLY